MNREPIMVKLGDSLLKGRFFDKKQENTYLEILRNIQGILRSYII